jgi:RNA polymerase sigma factor (sigma-70 family)
MINSEELAVYRPFVMHIARRVFKTLPRHYEFEDLVQVGFLGLLDAATRFDESRGVKFTTFAGTRVRGAILDMCRHDDPLGRLERKRNPDLLVMEQLCDFDMDRTAEVPFEPYDVIGARSLRRLLKDVPHRERFALVAHFGYDWIDPKIAKTLGVSPARANQLRHRAMRRVREKLQRCA